MERKDDNADDRPAPTAASIMIFAVAVIALFGAAFFFMPDHYRSTASGPAAEKTVSTPAPPATTGQGGVNK